MLKIEEEKEKIKNFDIQVKDLPDFRMLFIWIGLLWDKLIYYDNLLFFQDLLKPRELKFNKRSLPSHDSVKNRKFYTS